MNNNSAKKRERQNKVRRMRNKEIKSQIRTSVKAFDKAVETSDKEAATAAMKLSFKLIDSARTKGALHSNTASRKKSRLHAKLNKLA